jgi:hypothetical protein
MSGLYIKCIKMHVPIVGVELIKFMFYHPPFGAN